MDHNPRSGDQRWAIVRDGTQHGPDSRFLSHEQEWGPIESAMTFDTQDEAENGAVTLCPPFMPGHAESVSGVT